MATTKPEKAKTPEASASQAASDAWHGSTLWAVVARILRPQGLRGEVLAEVLTSFPERFDEREELHLLTGGIDSPESRVLSLESHRFPTGRNSGRVILKFRALDSIEAVEPLAKLELAVPWAERATLGEGEYYIPELVGCAVLASGHNLGTVQDVDTGATSIPLLIVRSPSGEEQLLPLAKAFLVGVDLKARTIAMLLPEGLLEINRAEPKTPEPARVRPVPRWKQKRDAAKAAAAVKDAAPAKDVAPAKDAAAGQGS